MNLKNDFSSCSMVSVLPPASYITVALSVEITNAFIQFINFIGRRAINFYFNLTLQGISCVIEGPSILSNGHSRNQLKTASGFKFEKYGVRPAEVSSRC